MNTTLHSGSLLYSQVMHGLEYDIGQPDLAYIIDGIDSNQLVETRGGATWIFA